jgi:hypothetical protein
MSNILMNIVKYSKKFNIIKNNLISSSRYSLKEYQNIQSKIKLSKTNNIKKFSAFGIISFASICYWKEQDFFRIISDFDLHYFLKSFASLFVLKGECEVKKKHLRIDDYEKTIISNEKKDEKFDWNEFLKLIYEEKLYFFAAIIVS